MCDKRRRPQTNLAVAGQPLSKHCLKVAGITAGISSILVLIEKGE